MTTEDLRLTEFNLYLTKVAAADEVGKAEWIKSLVRGKSVLDLGIVNHDLEESLKQPDKWLHGQIKREAESVLGVDILKSELDKLTATGYDVLVQDALTLRLDRKFDVVVCGDLIEHVNNPLALLQTMEWHLNDGGIGVVSTPNPFSAMRFMTFLVEGQTEVNTEHVMWLCPKTMYQLVDRSNLQISDFFWLKTDYTPGVTRRFFAHTSNFLGSLFAKRRRTMLDDFGVILRKS